MPKFGFGSPDFWLALVALLVSIVFSYVNWRIARKALIISQATFEQTNLAEVDVRLDESVWYFDQPLMLRITNLGEAPAKNIGIRIGIKPLQADRAMVNSSLQPFALLGCLSDQAQKEIDISLDVQSLLESAGILKLSSQHNHGVKLTTGAENTFFLIRIEYKWELRGHPTHTSPTLKRYYRLSPFVVEDCLAFDSDNLQWSVSGSDGSLVDKQQAEEINRPLFRSAN